MTIKVNNQQLSMLISVVNDQHVYARHDPDYFYSTGYESSDWADLFRILRSIDKHQEKQQPKRYPHRRRKRILKSLVRQFGAQILEIEPPIKAPTRWEQLRHSFSMGRVYANRAMQLQRHQSANQ